ncbi:MAG: HgcAB-associated protein [Spirochaetia bacterium]|nr:HgcAB-associated protein [Spirochaetia bacterium]
MKKTGGAKNQKQECCNVESILTIDERGQLVIPKEVREKSGIKAGDKLVLSSVWGKDSLCCFTLIKAESMSNMVENYVSPAFEGTKPKK